MTERLHTHTHGPNIHESESESHSVVFNPMHYTVYGIFQARILECELFPSQGDLPNPGIKLRSPALQVDSLPAEPQRSAQTSAPLSRSPIDLSLDPNSITTKVPLPCVPTARVSVHVRVFVSLYYCT